MALPEIEVGEDELVQALKDHISTLKEEVKRLRDKYEPERSSTINPAEKMVSLPLKPVIRTTAALIEALERQTRVKAEKNG